MTASSRMMAQDDFQRELQFNAVREAAAAALEATAAKARRRPRPPSAPTGTDPDAPMPAVYNRLVKDARDRAAAEPVADTAEEAPAKPGLHLRPHLDRGAPESPPEHSWPAVRPSSEQDARSLPSYAASTVSQGSAAQVAWAGGPGGADPGRAVTGWVCPACGHANLPGEELCTALLKWGAALRHTDGRVLRFKSARRRGGGGGTGAPDPPRAVSPPPEQPASPAPPAPLPTFSFPSPDQALTGKVPPAASGVSGNSPTQAAAARASVRPDARPGPERSTQPGPEVDREAALPSPTEHATEASQGMWAEDVMRGNVLAPGWQRVCGARRPHHHMPLVSRPVRPGHVQARAAAAAQRREALAQEAAAAATRECTLAPALNRRSLRLAAARDRAEAAWQSMAAQVGGPVPASARSTRHVPQTLRLRVTKAQPAAAGAAPPPPQAANTASLHALHAEAETRRARRQQLQADAAAAASAAARPRPSRANDALAQEFVRRVAADTFALLAAAARVPAADRDRKGAELGALLAQHAAALPPAPRLYPPDHPGGAWLGVLAPPLQRHAKAAVEAAGPQGVDAQDFTKAWVRSLAQARARATRVVLPPGRPAWVLAGNELRALQRQVVRARQTPPTSPPDTPAAAEPLATTQASAAAQGHTTADASSTPAPTASGDSSQHNAESEPGDVADAAGATYKPRLSRESRRLVAAARAAAKSAGEPALPVHERLLAQGQEYAKRAAAQSAKAAAQAAAGAPASQARHARRGTGPSRIPTRTEPPPSPSPVQRPPSPSSSSLVSLDDVDWVGGGAAEQGSALAALASFDMGKLAALTGDP